MTGIVSAPCATVPSHSPTSDFNFSHAGLVPERRAPRRRRAGSREERPRNEPPSWRLLSRREIVPPLSLRYAPAVAPAARLPALARVLRWPQRPGRDEPARRVRSRAPAARPEGAPLGEVFSFLSGLYFRGKLAYARGVRGAARGAARRARHHPQRRAGAAGDARQPGDLRELRPRRHRRGQPAVPRPARARRPRARRGRRARDCDRAPGQHRDRASTWTCCTQSSATACSFRSDFVGRGDMSRGGLMLRCAATGGSCEYAPVPGAVRHGPRPPKLPRPPTDRR